MATSNPEVGKALQSITGQDFSKMSPSEAQALMQKTPNFEAKLKATNITREQVNDHLNGMQKGWFDKYVKGEGGWLSFGTVGKVLSMKPVEGVVNAATFNKVPLLGKAARVAAIAAAVYFGIDVLKQGAVVAYNAGSGLLERIGGGAGHLFPEMNIPAVPPDLTLPPGFDPGATA
jgi:hypothetical protein